VDEGQLPTGAKLASDAAGKPVILFTDEWSCNFYSDRNPKVRLSVLPFEKEPEAVVVPALE